eukprot:m.109740 g.109740  ORF g.109740 m.109740 type:complete len:325 (+) comp15249_c3_seq1:574-1548(+)
MALGPNDTVVVAFTTGNDINLIVCEDLQCASPEVIRSVVSNASVVDIDVDASGNVVLVAAVGNALIYGYVPPFDAGFFGLSLYPLVEQSAAVGGVGIGFRTNGLPVIAASVEGGIAVFSCDDVVCWRHREAFIANDNTDSVISIDIDPISDDVVLFYSNGTSKDLVRAVVSGRSGSSILVRASPSGTVSHASALDGTIYGAFRDDVQVDLDQQHLFRCSNVSCNDYDSAVYYSRIAPIGAGPRFDLTDSGLLATAFVDDVNTLFYVNCADYDNCAAPFEIDVLVDSFDMKVSTSGLPVFAYVEAEGVVRIAQCYNDGCLRMNLP